MILARLFWSVNNPADFNYFCLTQNRGRIILQLLEWGKTARDVGFSLANSLQGQSCQTSCVDPCLCKINFCIFFPVLKSHSLSPPHENWSFEKGHFFGRIEDVQ